MTQRELARQVGCSQSNLAKIEKGRISPSYKLAYEIFLRLEAEEHRQDRRLRDVMRTDVASFDVSQTVGEAARAAKSLGVDQFPLLRRGHIVGSIRASSLIGVKADTPLGAVKGPPLPTVPPDTPVPAILSLLKSTGAVVASEDGRICGIVSAQDLL